MTATAERSSDRGDVDAAPRPQTPFDHTGPLLLEETGNIGSSSHAHEIDQPVNLVILESGCGQVITCHDRPHERMILVEDSSSKNPRHDLVVAERGFLEQPLANHVRLDTSSEQI